MRLREGAARLVRVTRRVNIVSLLCCIFYCIFHTTDSTHTLLLGRMRLARMHTDTQVRHAVSLSHA